MSEFLELYYDLETKKHSDMEAVAMGFENCVPGHSYGPIMRPYHIIHFITGGKGTLQIAKHTFHLEKGDVFYIPDDETAYYIASQTEPWAYSWCSFLGRRSKGFQYQFMTAASEKYVLRSLDTGQYADIIKKAAILTETNVSNYFFTNSVLLEIFSLLTRHIGDNIAVPRVPTMAERIKYHIDLKYTEKLQIQELADQLGIHPNYLSQIFHDSFGISPKQYLMGLKMSKAVNLLTTTEMPISSISISLGFEDQLAFSKSFKKYYGCPPTEYRKKNFSGSKPS